MNITVLKMFFSKQKHETVFDNYAFGEALNRELLKYGLNNIEYDTFGKNSRFSLKCTCTFKEKNISKQIMQVCVKGTSKGCYAKNKT